MNLDDYKRKLIGAIHDSYFVSGELSAADYCFEYIREKITVDQSIELLGSISNNSCNELELEGVLTVIKHYNWPNQNDNLNEILVMKLFGIVKRCLKCDTPTIKDAAISCIEHLDSLDLNYTCANEGIEILKSINCTESWLDNYRNSVIQELEETKNIQGENKT